MPDENCRDEVETDPESKYRRETFIFVIDTAIGAKNQRFTAHKAILTDFALLYFERFQNREVYAVSFKKAAQNYGLNDEKLREEYSSFIKNCSKLRNSSKMDSQEIKNKDL